MTIKKIKKWFREWDEEKFDFDRSAEEKPGLPESVSYDKEALSRPIEKMQEKEVNRYRRVYPVAAFLLGLTICAFLLFTVLDLPAFGSPDAPAHNEVMQRYVEKGTEETGAVNTVAGVILDYRAFDTLGESHVLYTALSTVLILLFAFGEGEEKEDIGSSLMRNDRILASTANVVAPIVILFGIYIIFNGHLGPGGGFSGGAVIGAGLILYAIAFGFERIERFLNIRSFRWIVLCALCFYSCSKAYSFFCGANGLESGITAGVPGRIFSAGLILPLNIAVGIVVACTMYGLYSVFKRGRI